jgi:replication factor C small subunit
MTIDNLKDELLWVQKYRPQTVSDTILPEKTKKSFQKFVDDRNIPNLLLCGGPGMGKTTAALAMVKELDGDYMMINGSLNGGIDTLRHQISSYASSVSFTGERKYVVVDECLDENTLVHVIRNGKKQKIKIKDLDDKNDLVKSYNIKKSKVEWLPFTLMDKGTRETFEIEFEDGSIAICTPEHKWFVEDKNGKIIVVKAKDLYKYNHILTTEKDCITDDTQGSKKE